MKTETFGTYIYILHTPRLDGTIRDKWVVALSKPNPPAALTIIDYQERRSNGREADNPHDGKVIPTDGKYTWINCSRIEGNLVHGVKNKDGKYEYGFRYDAGPGDLAWMEERDRNYLTRILKERRFRELEPAVWYLHSEERAQETNIGEWWSQKLKLPDIDAILKNAEEAEQQLRKTGAETPWKKEQQEKARIRQVARGEIEKKAKEQRAELEPRLQALTQQQEQAKRDAQMFREQVTTLQGQLQTQRAEFQQQLTELRTQLQQQQATQSELQEHTIANLHGEVRKLHFFKANDKHLWQEMIAARNIERVQQLIIAGVSPRGACFIPIMDELAEHAETLRAKGGICTVEQLHQELKTAVAQLALKPAERGYLKRLFADTQQLLQSWRENGLRNQAACTVLTQQAIVLLQSQIDNFPARLKGVLEDQMQIIQTDKYQAWLGNQLTREESNALDERIIESIYSRWINHSLQENPSASQLTRNIQVCLLERFRADTLLPDISVDLRDKIVEHVLALSQEKQLNQNLGKHIAQDARRLAHEENPEGLIFDMKPYFKKAVEQALAKWQSGELATEIADPLTEIMKLNTEQVPLKGELHSQLKIEAVKLLIQQFRADQLDALLKTELQASIKNTFVCLKPTEAETAKGLSMLLDLWHREELAPEEVAYVTTQVMQPWKELLGSLNAAINPMANPITHIQSDKSESVDGKVSHQFH